MNPFLAVFLGGGLGSLARYVTGRWCTMMFHDGLPWSTLISNTISSFLIGCFIGFASVKTNLDPTWRLLIVVGFCGGFSTFSAFSAETLELFKNGFVWQASMNVIGNITLCLLLTAAGIWIGRLTQS